MVRRYNNSGKGNRIVIPSCKYYSFTIPSEKIYNYSSPENEGSGHIDRLNEQNGFFDKLEESILKNGIRNPILVSIGWAPPAIFNRLPQDIQDNFNDTFICFIKGGSRLWVAQRNNIDVPCIVSDFIGKFSDQDDLDEEGVISCFRDGPVQIAHGDKGMVIRNLPHIHLGEENV